MNVEIMNGIDIDLNDEDTEWYKEWCKKKSTRESARLIEKEKLKRDMNTKITCEELTQLLGGINADNVHYINDIRNMNKEIDDLQEEIRMYKKGVCYMENKIKKLNLDIWYYENRLNRKNMFHFVVGECVNYCKDGMSKPYFAKIKKINYSANTFIVDVLMPNNKYILHYDVKVSELSKMSVVLNDKELYSDGYDSGESLIESPSEVPSFIESDNNRPIHRIGICTIM